jgi:hypothetical protein
MCAALPNSEFCSITVTAMRRAPATQWGSVGSQFSLNRFEAKLSCSQLMDLFDFLRAYCPELSIDRAID